MNRKGAPRWMLIGTFLALGAVSLLVTQCPAMDAGAADRGEPLPPDYPPEAAAPAPYPPPGTPAPGDLPGPGPAPPPAPERLREMIETLRAVRMAEALRLDEEAAARLAVRMRAAAEKREEIERARREMMQRMGEILRDADRDRRRPEEQALRPLLDRLRAEQDKGRGELEQLEERVRDGLSVEQQARMILFQQDFEREVQEMIRMARRGEGPPGPGPRPPEGAPRR